MSSTTKHVGPHDDCDNPDLHEHEVPARIADSFTCTEHGDKCVTIAECAENQGYVWDYPATAQ